MPSPAASGHCNVHNGVTTLRHVHKHVDVIRIVALAVAVQKESVLALWTRSARQDEAVIDSFCMDNVCGVSVDSPRTVALVSPLANAPQDRHVHKGLVG